jgi:hypothetical protein
MLEPFIRFQISLLSFIFLINIPHASGQKNYIPLKIGEVSICGAEDNKLTKRDLYGEKGNTSLLEFYTKKNTQVRCGCTFDEEARKLAKLIEEKTVTEIDTIVISFFSRKTMSIDDEQIYYEYMKYGRISKKYTYLDVLRTSDFKSVSGKHTYLSNYTRWAFIKDRIYSFSFTTGPCKHCRKTAKRSRNAIKRDFKQLCKSIKVEE